MAQLPIFGSEFIFRGHAGESGGVTPPPVETFYVTDSNDQILASAQNLLVAEPLTWRRNG